MLLIVGPRNGCGDIMIYASTDIVLMICIHVCIVYIGLFDQANTVY